MAKPTKGQHQNDPLDQIGGPVRPPLPEDVNHLYNGASKVGKRPFTPQFNFGNVKGTSSKRQGGFPDFPKTKVDGKHK